MTIKEIEEYTGLARSNIRFYERSGLISPVRKSNQYREYSQWDLNELYKIKLLRGAGISVEDIQNLQIGKEDLKTVLNERIADIEKSRGETRYAEKLCRILMEDGADYRVLDGKKYLETITAEEQEIKVVENAGNTKIMFIKRYIARVIDLNLYNLLWVFILERGFGISQYAIPDVRNTMILMLIRDLLSPNILPNLLTFATMLIIEPLMLAYLGATPGKWLLGINVRDRRGAKLDYRTSLVRTLALITFAYGFNVVTFVTLGTMVYTFYMGFIKGEDFLWDMNSWLNVTGEKTRFSRGVAFVAVIGLLIGGNVVLELSDREPPHRGDVTVEEFAENFNYLSEQYFAEYFGKNDPNCIDRNGTWRPEHWYPLFAEYYPMLDGGKTLYYTNGRNFMPIIFYEHEQGTVTQVKFIINNANLSDVGHIYPYQNLMLVAAMSFAGNTEEMNWYSREAREISNLINGAKPFTNFDITVNDTQITCKTNYSGLVIDEYRGTSLLRPSVPDKNNFYFEFTMTKIAE